MTPFRPIFHLSLLLLSIMILFIADGRLGFAQTTEGAEEEAVVPFVLPKVGPFHPEDIEITNNKAISDWYRSAHADASSEAFRHWDEDEAIRPVCSVCHSGEGFRAFHGLDGSEPGVPTEPVSVGGVVDCGTCHNAGLSEVKQVEFPSGLSHPVVGVEAACMTCHQGRTAGVTVQNAISDKPEDTIDAELRFINPHYATAAASWLGGYGGAGFHYAGRAYSGRFFHARPVSSCNSCHEPHTLEVAFEPCLTCHQADDPRAIRISRQSYDGSGDTSKGIRGDIETNAALLMEFIGRYASDVSSAPLVYDGNRYPYFFEDANRDGRVDETDGQAVAYASWTPRLLRAAYNWKLVTSDGGAYAHNPHYALELLYDSIADLAGPLDVDMADLKLLR